LEVVARARAAFCGGGEGPAGFEIGISQV